MAYMIAAYAIIWLLTFAFVASVFARQRRIQRDLALLEQMLEATRPDQRGD